MNTHEAPPTNEYIFSDRKRSFDVLVGSILAGATLPVEVAATYRLRKILDTGPMYFDQKRQGVIVRKLRTMLLAPPGQETGSIWDGTEINNPRITPGFPASVRKWRLDELPQLRQAVMGGVRGGAPRMSLVGIRPMLELHNDEMYEATRNQIPEVAERWYYQWCNVAPRGVISPSALHQARRSSNLELDAVDWVYREDAYCRLASEWTDLDLIQQTIVTVGSSILNSVWNATVDRSRPVSDSPSSLRPLWFEG